MMWPVLVLRITSPPHLHTITAHHSARFGGDAA
jgi:hypothetical protein